MILPLQKGRSVAYHVHIVTFTAIFEQQRSERAASLGAKVGAEAPLLRSAATVMMDSTCLECRKKYIYVIFVPLVP